MPVVQESCASSLVRYLCMYYRRGLQLTAQEWTGTRRCALPRRGSACGCACCPGHHPSCGPALATAGCPAASCFRGCAAASGACHGTSGTCLQHSMHQPGLACPACIRSQATGLSMAGGNSTVKIPSMVLPAGGCCAIPGLISMSMVVRFACAQHSGLQARLVSCPAGEASRLLLKLAHGGKHPLMVQTPRRSAASPLRMSGLLAPEKCFVPLRSENSLTPMLACRTECQGLWGTL